MTHVIETANYNNNSVSIKLDNTEITFDNNAVNALSNYSNVKFTLSEGNTNQYENCKAVIDVSLQGNNFSGGNATIKYALTESPTNNQVVKVYYVNDNGEKIDMNATFDGINVIFETNHFSRYIVVYENKPEKIDTNTTETENKNNSTIIIIVVAVIVVIAVTIVVVVILKKKNKNQKF